MKEILQAIIVPPGWILGYVVGVYWVIKIPGITKPELRKKLEDAAKDYMWLAAIVFWITMVICLNVLFYGEYPIFHIGSNL